MKGITVNDLPDAIHAAAAAASEAWAALTAAEQAGRPVGTAWATLAVWHEIRATRLQIGGALDRIADSIDGADAPAPG